MPYKGIISSTFDARVGEFIRANGQIKVDYSANPPSTHYAIEQGAPTITIADRDVVATAQHTGITYDQAYAQILVHELGHYVYSGLDDVKGATVSTVADAKQFIFNREAESAIFGATVTAEVRDNGGDFRVAGTSNINDLFSKVNVAVSAALNSQTADVFSAAVTEVAKYWASDASYQAYANANAGAVLQSADRFSATPHYEAQQADSYADYSGGCVEVSSVLPCGRTAEQISVGDELQLADEQTLLPASGIVSYSKRKLAVGLRVVTESGTELVCSDSAPIPVRTGGLLRPAGLRGQCIAVRDDAAEADTVRWERVDQVEVIGPIEVQHITVGNRSFWAGAKRGRYVLHHNVKMAPGGGGGDWDPFDGWYSTAGTAALSASSVAPSGMFDAFGHPVIGLVGQPEA